jgi:hypothetical protein
MKKLLAMSLLLASSLSYAFTGNELLNALNSKDPYMNGAAAGFINGYSMAKDEDLYCIPPKVTVGQVIGIVRKLLEEHPDKRHQEASAFVAVSLVNAFPCAKKEQWSG